MWPKHINTHRNPGTDIVSKIISYFPDIFKGFTIFCRKNFFKKFVISGYFPRLIYNRADVFFVRTSVRYFLIKIKGCEPLMSDPSGSTYVGRCTEKMTTEYH